MNERNEQYLRQYLKTLTPAKAKSYHSFSADYFCADEYNANLCAELILRGEKQASCSMEYWYSHKGEVMPAVGHLQVVNNWAGDPVCIIELTEVTTARFKDVDAEFAAAEGEGDRSLKWWRDAHWNFFSRECEELNIEPSEEMFLVLERFKVVYS
ncbi:ASCH domain-containing protein [Vibrio sp. TBV020]|uniref:ASCH domain-containing protein n=1 Tax=Vibrio sp. TBV020 TaxID=3137398 RepID=UPI0038CD3901